LKNNKTAAEQCKYRWGTCTKKIPHITKISIQKALCIIRTTTKCHCLLF